MIKLHKSKDNQYYFTVSSKNGKVLVTSETYKRKANAIKGMWALDDVMFNHSWSFKDLTNDEKQKQ